MKLERLDVFTSNGEECRQYISDGEFVEWTPELQEAWDNRAFSFNGKVFADTVAKYPISMMDALLLMEVAIQKRIAEGY